MSKKQSTKETTQKIDIQQIIADIFGLFDALFSIRLIDKISRPIQNAERGEVIAEYKQKFNQLHHKLDNLRRLSNNNYYAYEGTSSQKNQEKSTKVHKPTDYKNQVRRIQSRYIQLFRDGSFKHYDKIAKLHGLPQNFYLINIQNWTSEALGSLSIRKSCC